MQNFIVNKLNNADALKLEGGLMVIHKGKSSDFFRHESNFESVEELLTLNDYGMALETNYEQNTIRFNELYQLQKQICFGVYSKHYDLKQNHTYHVTNLRLKQGILLNFDTEKNTSKTEQGLSKFLKKLDEDSYIINSFMCSYETGNFMNVDLFFPDGLVMATRFPLGDDEENNEIYLTAKDEGVIYFTRQTQSFLSINTNTLIKELRKQREGKK